MSYVPDYVAQRRREQKRARHRRRLLAVLSIALLAGSGAAIAALANSAHTGHRPASRTSRPVTAATPALARPRRSSDGERAQLAAVRRLARYGLPLFCGGRSRRMVALTFDDGPGPYTHLAVRKLRQAHAMATFFLVGKEITAFAGLAASERPVAAVGDHTMTHPFLPALGHAAMAWQITAAKRLIARAAEQPVALFRPPYEGRTAAIDAEARRLGLLEVLWSVDSADSLGANYAGIERNVKAGLRPGAIILMHENRGQTIRALPVIFAALRRDRLRAVTIPELVAADPPSPSQLRAGGRVCGVRPHRRRD